MSLFSDEIEPGKVEQLKMPDVTCPTCGQHWPLVPTEAPKYELIESAPTVTRLDDGTIITTETIMKIEPPEPETGEQDQ